MFIEIAKQQHKIAYFIAWDEKICYFFKLKEIVPLLHEAGI